MSSWFSAFYAYILIILLPVMAVCIPITFSVLHLHPIVAAVGNRMRRIHASILLAVTVLILVITVGATTVSTKHVSYAEYLQLPTYGSETMVMEKSQQMFFEHGQTLFVTNYPDGKTPRDTAATPITRVSDGYLEQRNLYFFTALTIVICFMAFIGLIAIRMDEDIKPITDGHVHFRIIS